MLRVDAILVLDRDVYPLIPKEHLQVPPRLSQNPSQPQFLSPQGCQISIVGNDRNDCLLIFYKGFSKVRTGVFGPHLHTCEIKIELKLFYASHFRGFFALTALLL